MSLIGDLFLRIIADDKGFEADLVAKAGKAGDAAGATLGERMGAGIKRNGAKLIGATFAAGLAIAGKGVLELQNITADFRAETGATEEEAKRAGQAINEMSGRNIQPMAEIGAALTKVHTDMGLVGAEAEATTQKFLRFGRVTKVDAAAEVKSFDDILDAWGLTAKDVGPIMDALVVSHQKFGGVIADDEIALRDLAPTLLASNQTWQDGLALIDLFKASGADVATAVTGITKALGKVKSPEELQALIDDIVATEDPFVRAAKAADLFGAKAGAKLANVLKPGMTGLDDYKISVDEAAGATEKAAQVLDSTLGARFQLLIKQAGSAIIGLGNDWGGLATVIATTLTVASGLGGGRLLKALSGGLTGGLKGAWTKAAGSSVVTKAVAFASGKAATIYLAGLIAGDAIGDGLAGAWKKVPGSSAVSSAIDGAGKFMGSKLGKVLSVGFAAVAVVELIKTFQDVQAAIAQQTADLAAKTGTFIQTATLDALVKAREGVAQQLASLDKDPIADALGLSARKGIETTLAQLDAAIGTFTDHAAGDVEGMRGRIDTSASGIKKTAANLGSEGSKGFGRLGDAAQSAAQLIKTNADIIAARIKGLTATLLGEATALINGYYDPLIAQEELLVLKDQVSADKRAVAAARAALAKTKAGSAERHDAQLTLDQALLAQTQSQKALDQTRLNLLASGQLSARQQKAWLADLQKKYKTATGAAKTYIGGLIAKIHELQNVASTATRVSVTITSSGSKTVGRHRATGGPVQAGQPYIVNENTPNSELWVPSVSGRVLSGAVPATAAGAGGGDTIINVPVSGLMPVRSPRDIVTELVRVRDVGLLPGKRITPMYPRPPGT